MPTNRPLKNYCARLCGVEISLTAVRLNALQRGPEGVSEANQMLMYSSYTALSRLIDQRSCYCVAPCLAVARYIFQQSVQAGSCR
jgi:hypothetical protein